MTARARDTYRNQVMGIVFDNNLRLGNVFKISVGTNASNDHLRTLIPPLTESNDTETCEIRI